MNRKQFLELLATGGVVVLARPASLLGDTAATTRPAASQGGIS